MPNQIQLKVLDHLQVSLIRTRNAPLANAIEALVLGGTYRDDPYPVATDISVAIAARDPTTALSQAILAMGATMGGLTIRDKACKLEGDINTASL